MSDLLPFSRRDKAGKVRYKTQPTEMEAFLVRVQGTQDGGCWIWRGTLAAGGYGAMRFRGKTKKAHRAAWELFFGPIPNGMAVCHKCDNPPCVNPNHLFTGTIKDNVDDMVRKGRDRKAVGDANSMRKYPEKCLRGSRNGMSKLTESEAYEIKQLSAIGMKQYEIAKRFNVCEATVGHILTKRTWRHVPEICRIAV